MRQFFANNRILLKLLLPVVFVGLACSTAFVGYMSKPLKDFLVSQFNANLELASVMGLRTCEESFAYLLDLRLEGSEEMNRTMQHEAMEEIKSISGHFPHIHVLVLESGDTIRAASLEGIPELWTGPALNPGGNELFMFQLGGENVRAHKQFFPFWDWHIISFVFEEDYGKPIRLAYLVTYASSGGVFLAVVLTLILVFRKFIHKPLNALVSATQGVSQGKPSKIEVSGHNEFEQLMRSFNTMIDSLESEKAEVRNLIRQLRDSETRFRALFEQASWSVFVHDDQGWFLDVNPFACAQLGYSREELLAMNVTDVDPDAAILLDKEAIWTKDHVDGTQFEARHRRKDGSSYFAEINLTTIMFEGRRIFVALAQDITERRMAQDALRESEQRFRSLLEDVDMVAVQGYDENRKVTYWNRASERLYGYSKEEALGRILEDLIIPEEMHGYVRASVKEWIEQGVSIPSSELELRHKDGSPVPVYSSHVIQEDSRGGKELYCIDVDLADIKRAHSQLVQAKEQAEAANHAKSEFLANMSHEIRTPLNGIIGMLQLLKTTSQDPEQKEYTDVAITSSGRLTRLLSDILDLSRIEARKIDIKSEPFSIRETMENTIQLFGPVARQKGIDLLLHLDPAIPETLNGDAVRLQQVLSNLVGNAVKFTETGSVEIEAYPLPASKNGGHRVLFTVADTGPGIPSGKLQHLFAPFTQVSEGYTRQHQGAGLGLAICKNLVELMQGGLAVDSELGAGTTFHFCVTFDEAKAMQAKPWQTMGLAMPQNKGHNVLLAEDDMVSGFAARKLLEGAGHDVTVVEDGSLALEALRSGDFDLVLMDIQMPVMDGLEATKAIRGGEAGPRNTNVPIIALTAYAMVGDQDKFITAGMNGYVTKPLELENLLEAMAHAMLEYELEQP